MIQNSSLIPHWQQTEYKFQLDVDIKITDERPLFQSREKIIHKVDWINRSGPSIVLLQIGGPRADQEASFNLRFSGHPNIITTYGRVRNESNSIMLLQECSSKPDLSEMLRENEFKPTEIVLCTIFEQICNAMIFLANNDVVHGDLACHNILVFQSNPTKPKSNLVKLIDFGLTRDSVANSSANTSTTIIPVRYAAPEILRDTSTSNYSEKSDVYSMGVLMWEACSYGKLPYSSLENDDDVLQRKLADKRLPRPSLCSDQLWNIINECWHQNQKQRPSFRILKQRLSNLDSQPILQLDQQTTRDTTFRSPFACLAPITRNSFNYHNPRSLSPSSAARIQRRHNRSSSQSIVDNDEIESEYRANDSQQGYIIEERQELYNLSNHKTRPVPCKFCQELFPSSIALHDHLLLCGNKTELCQICHQYIRRAIFNYHSENNCANLDETNIISSRNRIRSGHLSSRNSNRETFEMSMINVGTQENHRIRDTSNYSTKPILNRRASPIRVECDYCHYEIAQNNYRIHKNNCLQNPTNRSRARSLANECNIPCTPVYIPCEICNEQIEKSNYSTHSKNCHERDKRRNEKRAQKMNRQSATEPIPCEYCEQLYPGDQLSSHQRNCSHNPLNMTLIQTPIRRQYPLLPHISPIIPHKSDRNFLVSPSISRSSSQSSLFTPTRGTHFNRLNHDRNRLTPIPNVCSNYYSSIDLDRNHPSNGLRNDDRSNRKITTHQSRKSRVTFNIPSFESRNIPRKNSIYENLTVLSQEHRLYDRQDMVYRSNSNIISVNQRADFRLTSIRSNSACDNFQNSTYTPNTLFNVSPNKNLNVNIDYNQFQRKKKRTRSRRHRSRRTRTRHKQDRFKPSWQN